MRKPHILIIPFPAQGHVIPAMELALNLAEHGCKITFVNTEFNHERVMKSLPETDSVRELVQMVSLPDGLKPSDDRDDIELLWESILDVMPGELAALVQRINGSESEKVSCLIADVTMAWALEVAEEMGIKKAAFWPAAVALLALILEIPRLTEDGILDSDGQPMKMQSIQLSPTMPFIKPTDFHWNCAGDHKREKGVFKFFVKVIKPTKLAERLICNSSNCLESGTFASYPDFLAIGPLLASNRLGKSTGYFWQEDSGCLAWLDQQPPNSVIYVAFGSYTIFDQNQFEELAIGLELTNRPFLWVVRENIIEDVNNAYPMGFNERVHHRGQMVSWAPQQKVLSHPSVACFISHCGWNSTIEGISNGIPFLCWPYFADQLFNRGYICDYLKIGLGFNKDDSGIIRREEIKNKLEQLLSDERFKERALDLQTKIQNSVREGGSSYENFNDFVAWIKD
ncbi:UDP-glycosyltransferase 83A1-like [Olea europaea subsp. europaea]|uniref:UDP-glycosyltransferase 83A1-like n=1 Tax=Olea europaea subsp. europaea TaxID=158383 RepID=A0A8S0PI63_OLEEU|nr:UDP-glycosyltransferase 83A1-like [Olea europaea subsp. europaea]